MSHLSNPGWVNVQSITMNKLDSGLIVQRHIGMLTKVIWNFLSFSSGKSVFPISYMSIQLGKKHPDLNAKELLAPVRHSTEDSEVLWPAS